MSEDVVRECLRRLEAEGLIMRQQGSLSHWMIGDEGFRAMGMTPPSCAEAMPKRRATRTASAALGFASAGRPCGDSVAAVARVDESAAEAEYGGAGGAASAGQAVQDGAGSAAAAAQDGAGSEAQAASASGGFASAGLHDGMPSATKVAHGGASGTPRGITHRRRRHRRIRDFPKWRKPRAKVAVPWGFELLLKSRRKPARHRRRPARRDTAKRLL